MRFLPGAPWARGMMFVAAFASVACDGPFSSSRTDDDLADARRKWSQERIASYSVTVGQSCFCVEDARGPFRVAVTNGRVVSVTDPATGAPRAASEYVPLTVEALFERVEQAIAYDDELEVRYDPDLGYPRLIDINSSQRPVDGGVTIEVSDLVPTR